MAVGLFITQKVDGEIKNSAPSLLTAEEAEELFRRLRSIRWKLAEEQGQPPYFVFSDRALRAMVQSLAQSQSEFLQLPGVGKRKLEMYYALFTNEIYAYCASHKIDLSKKVPYEPIQKERRLSIDIPLSPRKQTLELYRHGLSIEEIAQERACSPSTVVAHLCQLIEADEEVDISSLVGAERQMTIFNALKEVGDSMLRPVKDVLGDEYSFDEIRLVRAVMRRSPDE
jgi:ATP-dependent DNA helicase RecQ